MSSMDTSGFSTIGKYGTISLMKRQELDGIITSFGVDSEEITFGRDPSCSVRLYYPDVSLVHCKLIFEERKAFLVVLGETGLQVDGYSVYPNATAIPTTVPLSNNSEIAIHHKRFRFTYPPKGMRATLFSTPPETKNRNLRLSMIQSAQVFSPRPSQDPRENLRILQSPLKNRFKSPVKPSQLSRPPMNSHHEPEEQDEIVLVDGNNPRVVEEERDLVILEDVEAPPPAIVAPQASYRYQPPQTPPRRKSVTKNTLHRAVLIRSAQRAILRAEEEEEEQEVLETVVGPVEESDEDPELENDEDVGDEGEYEDETEEYEEEVRDEPREQSEHKKSMWRKSLERIWPFKGSDDPENEQGEGLDEPSESEEEHDYDEEEDDNEVADSHAPLPSIPMQTPLRKPLGTFMTPQARAQQNMNFFSHVRNQPQAQSAAGRFSLGGGEARRVLLEQPWRVKDIILPPAASTSNASTMPADPSPPTPRPVRSVLSEEERKAIQERRRSALRAPDNFFAGGIPGMSPSKASKQSLPISPAISHTTNSSSPAKLVSQGGESTGEEEEMDTRSLLEKMKETVEGMKRRRSVAPNFGGVESTPRPAPATPLHRTPAQAAIPVTPNSSRKLNFFPPEDKVEEGPDSGDSEEAEEVSTNYTEPVFSLLRPEAKEDLARRKSLPPVHQSPQTSANNAVQIVVEDVDQYMLVGRDEEVKEPEEEPKKGRGRARLLRPQKAAEDESEPGKELERSRSREPSRSPQIRSTTPRLEESEGGQSDSTPAQEVLPVKMTAVRRPRKAALAESEEAPLATTKRSARKGTVEPEERAAPTSLPVAAARRGRKPTAEPEEIVPQKPAVKRGRKAVATPTATENEEEDVSIPAATIARRTVARRGATKAIETPEVAIEPPVRKGRPTKAATSETKKRAANVSRAKVKEDGDDDPLDTLDATGDVEDEPSQRMTTKVQGKKKAVVKEEVVEDVEQPAPPPPKVGRAKAGTALKTPATKSKANKKTPATAPPAVAGVDKENTRSESGSRGDSPGESDDVAVKVKISKPKATKASVAAKVGVKKEEVEEPARTTRVMRTRTRTKTG